MRARTRGADIPITLDDAVHQHDPGRTRSRTSPAITTSKKAAPLRRAGTRWRWSCAANKKLRRARRPRRDVLVVGDADGRRLQPLLASAVGQARRRPRVLPGPRVARRLRARVRRRPHHRRAARAFPARSRRQGAELVSASVADAGFLAVPDRVDGARPAAGRLPGALHEDICTIAASRIRRGRKVWVFVGDGEIDEPETLGAASARRAREPRQPDLRRQLQSAAPRRPGARQRQDHPGTRRRTSAAPAGTSSK